MIPKWLLITKSVKTSYKPQHQQCMRFYIALVCMSCVVVLMSQNAHNSATDSFYLYKIISQMQSVIEAQNDELKALHALTENQNKVIAHQYTVIKFEKTVNFSYTVGFGVLWVCAMLFAVFAAFFEYVSPQKIDAIFSWLSTQKAKILSFFIKKT